MPQVCHAVDRMGDMMVLFKCATAVRPQTTGKLGATEMRWLADLAHFHFTMCTARRHWASVSREDPGTGQNPLLLEWHWPRHHGVLPTVRTVHSGERGTEGA